jgi:hypothetical protein
MRAEFFTKGFEKSESMDEFMQKSAMELADTFLRNERDIHLRMTVDEDSHRLVARKPHFSCEFLIKSAGSKKYLKTMKSSYDARTAIYEAVHAMKKILTKKSDLRRHRKIGGRGRIPSSLAA